MSKAPESLVVDSARRAIKAEYPNAHILKIHGSLYQATGFPDLLVLIDGRAYALEFKHIKASETADEARDRASARQRLVIAELRKAGVPADVVTGPAEALAVISGHQWFFLPEISGPAPI